MYVGLPLLQFVLFFTGNVSYKIPLGFFPSINEPRDTVGSASIFPLFKLFYSILSFCFLRLSFLLLLQQIFLFVLTGASSTTEKLPCRLLSSKPENSTDMPRPRESEKEKCRCPKQKPQAKK